MELGQLAMELLQLGVSPGELSIGSSVCSQLCQIVELLSDSLVEVALITLRIMDDGTQRAQAQGYQAIVNHIERRALVADKKNTFSAGQMVANDVGNRLAFA